MIPRTESIKPGKTTEIATRCLTFLLFFSMNCLISAIKYSCANCSVKVVSG